MIDCREAVRRMWAYLDHQLADRPFSEFEMHLETCQRCCGELEFNRHLRGLVADRPPAQAMPPEVRSRLDILLASGESQLEKPT